MAEARSMLRHESGAMSNRMVMIDRLEWRPGPQANRYDWEAEGWTGGDTDRLAFKTKGEGAFGGKAEKIELQAGWLHAIDPWFDVRAGIRQDFQAGPHRTQAVVAVEGLAPYWLDVEAELFLSQKGELTARTEASYDQRLTQSLILQPRAELNISAQDVPELGLGSGLNSVELGLRLRYEITRRLGPYVGVSWERKLGGSARYARADDEKPQGARFVTGIRLWF
ncbi:copper resistance protein B [Sphingosinicellaceae bacterium]|nr:copper resistance protein B [Sphingosinicellaceae bacterium]